MEDHLTISMQHSASNTSNQCTKNKEASAVPYGSRTVQSFALGQTHLNNSHNRKNTFNPFESFLTACQLHNKAVSKTDDTLIEQSTNEKWQHIYECYGVANDSIHGRIIHKNRLLTILKKYKQLRPLAHSLEENYEFYIVLKHFFEKNSAILNKYRGSIEQDISGLQSDFIKTALRVICEVVDDLAMEGVHITGGFKKSLLISEKSEKQRAMPFNDIDIIAPNEFDVERFIKKIDEKSSGISAHQATIHYHKSDYLESIQTIPFRPNDINQEDKNNPLWLDFCTLKKEAGDNLLTKAEVKKSEEIKEKYQPLQCYLDNISTKEKNSEITLSDPMKRNIETLSKANFFLETLNQITSAKENIQPYTQWKPTSVAAATEKSIYTAIFPEKIEIKRDDTCKHKEQAPSQTIKTHALPYRKNPESAKGHKPKKRKKSTSKQSVKHKKEVNPDTRIIAMTVRKKQPDANLNRKKETKELVNQLSTMREKIEKYESNSEALKLKFQPVRKKTQDLCNKIIELDEKKNELKNKILNIRKLINEHSIDGVTPKADTVKKKSKRKKKAKSKSISASTTNSFQVNNRSIAKTIAMEQKDDALPMICKEIQDIFTIIKNNDNKFKPKTNFTYSCRNLSLLEDKINDFLNPNFKTHPLTSSEYEKKSYLHISHSLVNDIYENLDALIEIKFKSGTKNSKSIQYENAEKISEYVISNTTILVFEAIFYCLRKYNYGQKTSEQDSLDLVNALLDELAEFKKHAFTKTLSQVPNSKNNIENYLTFGAMIFKYLFNYENQNYDFNHSFTKEISGGFFLVITSAYLTSINKPCCAILYFNKWFNYISNLTQDNLNLEFYSGHKHFITLIKEPTTRKMILKNKEKYISCGFKNSLTYDLMFNIEKNSPKNRACEKNSNHTAPEKTTRNINKTYEGIREIVQFYKQPFETTMQSSFICNDHIINGLYLGLKENFATDLIKFSISQKRFEKDKKSLAVPDYKVISLKFLRTYINTAYQEIEVLCKIYFHQDTEHLERLKFNIPEKILCTTKMFISNLCARSIWIYLNLYYRDGDFSKGDEFKYLLSEINSLLDNFIFTSSHFKTNFDKLGQPMQETHVGIDALFTYTSIAFKHLFNFENTQLRIDRNLMEQLDGIVFPILIADYLLKSEHKIIGLHPYKKWFHSISTINQRDLSLTQRRASEFSFNFLTDKDTNNYITNKIKPLIAEKKKENLYTKIIENIDKAPLFLYKRPACDFLQRTHLLQFLEFSSLVIIDPNNECW